MFVGVVALYYVMLMAECHNSRKQFFDQGIVFLNRNGNSATFSSHVCIAKKI